MPSTTQKKKETDGTKRKTRSRYIQLQMFQQKQQQQHTRKQLKAFKRGNVLQIVNNQQK